MSAAAQWPLLDTVQEFLTWNPGDGRPYELVDGVPRAMAPASNVHGLLQAELGRLIGNHLRQHRPECEVIANPGIVPRILSGHNFRIADLGVTCARIRPGSSMLPEPILLVEILSPNNQADTWSNVWTYTSIPTVQEILVLHSGKVAAELLSRTGEGGWPDGTETVRDGDLALGSIGFRVLVGELYARSGLSG